MYLRKTTGDLTEFCVHSLRLPTCVLLASSRTHRPPVYSACSRTGTSIQKISVSTRQQECEHTLKEMQNQNWYTESLSRSLNEMAKIQWNWHFEMFGRLQNSLQRVQISLIKCT